MKKSKTFISILVYKTIIELIYVYAISPQYSYSGLTFHPNYLYCFFSYLSLSLILFTLSISKRKNNAPSQYLFYFLLLFVYIPLSSYFWLNNQSITYFIFVTLCIFLIRIFILLPRIKVAFIKENSDLVMKIIFFSYIIISVFMIIRRGGIDSRAFDFDTIYELREENNMSSGILGYILNWNVKAIAPFFMAIFFYEKKFLKLFVVCTLQLLYYLSFGNKAFLFSIFVVLMTSILIRYSDFLLKFSVFFSLANVISFLLKEFLNIDFLLRAIPYRMIYISSQIQFQYYTFFKVHEKLHFSETLIGKIFGITNNYGIPIPILISRVFSGNYENNSYSNTGIFSDAYANGGLTIMTVVTVAFSFLLITVDSIASNVPLQITIPAFSYIMFVINDTPLLTTLLTGGFALMIVLLYILSSSYSKENREKIFEPNIHDKQILRIRNEKS